MYFLHLHKYLIRCLYIHLKAAELAHSIYGKVSFIVYVLF